MPTTLRLNIERLVRLFQARVQMKIEAKTQKGAFFGEIYSINKTGRRPTARIWQSTGPVIRQDGPWLIGYPRLIHWVR
jgi:hypothetical protein